MRSFGELTYRGQIERLRALGTSALKEFGLRSATLRHLAHAENTTFEVNGPRGGRGKGPGAPYVPGRYLLRIHRPGYQTPSAVNSEISWLAALRTDLDMHVPDPVPARDGSHVVVAEGQGVPEARACTLLRWMDGTAYGRKGERQVHLRMLGALMARLHEHAASWKRPSGFERGRWDWYGLFESPGTAGTDETWVWDTLPVKERRLYEAAARKTADAIEDLGDSDDAFGLIHADLHLANVLFRDGEARPIDFDDCGDGYWVYDMASVLHDYRRKDDWPAWRDALLEGYREVRPLPDGVDQHLETLMCTRCASLMLWTHARARENPRFRKRLGSWSKWAVEYLTDFCSE